MYYAIEQYLETRDGTEMSLFMSRKKNLKESGESIGEEIRDHGGSEDIQGMVKQRQKLALYITAYSCYKPDCR